MRKENESRQHWLIAALRKYFLAGVVVVVPIAAALLVLIWVFNSVDNILQPVIREVIVRWVNPDYTGAKITGLGFVVTLVLIFTTGMIASNYVGRKLIKFGDSQLARVPVFSQIYGAVKQVVEGISGLGLRTAAFRKVVYVEFPIPGMKSIAFVTNEVMDPRGNKLYCAFIPTVPNPATGYLLIATPNRIYPTDLSIDEAMKIIISAGIILPTAVEPQASQPKLLQTM
jgi:uncharacterized membrane protein